ncbi:MAG: hypothetical protein BWY64_03396 [bacterium ADurb.Bin363]|nr:MAG: hypothetical protein BWY64_03396 [bacterium ADurb.Bin363]
MVVIVIMEPAIVPITIWAEAVSPLKAHGIQLVRDRYKSPLSSIWVSTMANIARETAIIVGLNRRPVRRSYIICVEINFNL